MLTSTPMVALTLTSINVSILTKDLPPDKLEILNAYFKKTQKEKETH